MVLSLAAVAEIESVLFLWHEISEMELRSSLVEAKASEAFSGVEMAAMAGTIMAQGCWEMSRQMADQDQTWIQGPETDIEVGYGSSSDMGL